MRLRPLFVPVFLAVALPVLAQSPPGSPAPDDARSSGLQLAREGNWLEAYKQLRPWAQAHPDDAQARLVAAYAAVRLQRTFEAERLLSDLPQSEPRVRLLWAEVLLTQGNPWGAHDMLKPLEKNPPPELARDLRRLLDLAAKQAAGPPPSAPVDPVERTIAQAAELAAAGQAEEGLRKVRDERLLSPDDLRPRFMEGYLLLKLQRAGEALRVAEETVVLAQDNADAVYLRGAALLALGRGPEAERDLRQALALQSNHLGAMSDLAALLIGQGKKDEARRLLEAILAVRPEDPVALGNLKKLEPSER